MFEWDPEKERTNQAKHGVAFADATEVFEDARAITQADPHPREKRLVTLGLDALGRLLVVCWTSRGSDRVRIISARKATRSESRAYGKDG